MKQAALFESEYQNANLDIDSERKSAGLIDLRLIKVPEDLYVEEGRILDNLQ